MKEFTPTTGQVRDTYAYAAFDRWMAAHDAAIRDAALEEAALRTVSKAAQTWAMPLLDSLTTEGHDEACDALVSENITLCDCWWGRLRTAIYALKDIADLADATHAAKEGEGK